MHLLWQLMDSSMTATMVLDFFILAPTHPMNGFRLTWEKKKRSVSLGFSSGETEHPWKITLGEGPTLKYVLEISQLIKILLATQFVQH